MAERSPAQKIPKFCEIPHCWPCWRKLVDLLEIRMARRIEGDVCYFVAAREFQAVKIGIAGNLSKCLSSLQTGFPYKLRVVHLVRPNEIYRVAEIEAKYHRHFEAVRARGGGEWFAPLGELRKMLEKIAEVRCG